MPPAERASRPGRLRRALAAIGAALGLGVVFVGATVTGVVLHLDLKPTKRIAIKITNKAFESVFTGRLVPDQIDHISLHGVDIKSFDAYDPAGLRVVHATGIHATFNGLATLRKIVLEGDPHIVIHTAHVEQADVLIQSHGANVFGIAEAFTPKPSKEPPPPPSKGPPGKPLRFEIKHIEIDHVTGHGAIVPAVTLDADVQHVVASLAVGPDGVAIDVAQASVAERKILPFRSQGVAFYHARVGSAGKPDDLKMWMGLTGQVGDVQVEARASIENGVMTAHADVPRAKPEQLATLVPGLVPRDAVSASGDLVGTIPTFAIAANATIEGGGRIDVDGMLDATGALRVLADAHLTDVRPDSFVALDSTPVNADARVRVELADAFRATAEVRTEPFVIQDQVIPAVDAFASYDHGILDGSVEVHEEGAPTRAAFAVSPTDGVRFAATSTVASLRQVPRIPGAPLDGSARVRVSGSVRKGELDAKVSGTYAGVSAGQSLTVQSGSFDGRVYGPLLGLRVDARTSGTAMHAGTYDFDTFKASASGPIGAPHLEADATGEKSGSVSAKGVLDAKNAGVRDVDLSIQKTGDTISGHIARVGASGGGVSVEGVSLEGKDVGKLEGQLRIVHGEIVGKLHGEEVDLGRIAKLFGLPVRMKGIANLDVHVAANGKGRTGHAALELEDAEVGGLAGVSANLNATFEDQKVKVDGLLRLITTPRQNDTEEDWCDGAIAQVRLENGSAEIDGPLLDPRSWERAYGSAKVAAEDWNLRCLARLVPIGLVLSDVKGRVGLRATVERKRGARFASVHDVLLRTRGLEVAGPQPLGADAPTWESRHVDLEVKGDFDGTSGATEAAIELVDEQTLLKVKAKADLDLAALVDHPDKRWATLQRTNMSLGLVVPKRELTALANLPTFISSKLPPLAGQAYVGIFLDGTLEKPFVAVKARGFDLSAATRISTSAAAAWSVPFDAEITGSYDGQKAALDVKAQHAGAQVASAKGTLELAIADILAGETPKWRGALEAKLEDVPLGDVPFFVDREVSGKVAGTVKIDGIHDQPTVVAELALKELKIGPDLYFDKSRLKIDIQRKGAVAPGQPDKATARAELELASNEGGSFTTTGFVGVIWKDGMIPLPDAEAGGGVDVKATRFRLAAIQPAVANVFSKLDGFFDGAGSISWKKLAEDDAGVVRGNFKVTKGVFHVPKLGQEFHDAHVTVKTLANGVIQLEDIGADGTRGHIGGKGQIHLDGMKLKEARVDLAIADRQDVPLTLEGVPLGDLRGKFEIVAKMHEKDKEKEKELDVDVKIPSLHLELPPAPGRGVQALDDNPDVHVSHALHAQEEPRSASALKMVIAVHVDDALIEGTGLRVALRSSKSSPPKIVLSDEMVVSGDIHLTRGKLTVFGKEFTVEETAPNLVHMQGDIGNPYLNVTARWDAPDGTEVFIDYIGPLQPITADKIKLRSVPSYPPDQIMTALLLGGDFSQTQSSNTAQQFAGGVAAGVGGSLAAQQFNALLSGIAPLRGFSTRVNTAQDGSLQTSVVYDISDKFSATATFDQGNGTQTPTGGPGTTTTTAGGAMSGGYGGTAAQKTGATTTLSIDWHFWKNWLLRGSVGLGAEQPVSGIDFLWQYRY